MGWKLTHTLAGIAFLVSYCVSAISWATPGAERLPGISAAFGASILLLGIPFRQNNSDMEPWSSLIGLSVLANVWFVVGWFRIWDAIYRSEYYRARGLLPIGLIAVTLTLMPFVWSWTRKEVHLLPGYYLWVVSTVALLACVWQCQLRQSSSSGVSDFDRN